VHVPFQGGAPAVQNLIGGHIDMSYGTLPSVLPFVESGQLKLIAAAEPKRIAEMPDLPTINETVPGVETTTWVGVFAPAGTPKAIVDWVNTEIKNAQTSPDMKARLEPFEPWYMTPEQTAARIRADYDKYGYLIKLTGTKLE